ncbi:hypothetical protein [Promicromonospora sp. NPDC050249]|uniref:hypothetical protein n=1 Tax=Promicromonospora sp. NPDC050249 TaxID=3154743 RepID=UPI0033D7F864
MTNSVTFWAQPNKATHYGLAPARHGWTLVVSSVFALGCIVGTVLIVRHVAALDWDQYSAWSTLAHRQLANSILVGLALSLGAVGLVYASHHSIRGLIRNKADARRDDADTSHQAQKAALTLNQEGFKHWAARPTRAPVPWTEVVSWTATQCDINITLTDQHHDGQVVNIPFADINAARRQITAAFERFSGQPPTNPPPRSDTATCDS